MNSVKSKLEKLRNIPFGVSVLSQRASPIRLSAAPISVYLIRAVSALCQIVEIECARYLVVVSVISMAAYTLSERLYMSYSF